MNYFEHRGYHYAKGVCKYLGKVLIIFIMAMFLLILISPTDDSDLSWYKRSGLRIHTDYKTGLQYFATMDGGITPRLNINGEQMRIE